MEDGVAPGQRIHADPMYGAISWANFTAAMAAPALGVARGFLGAYRRPLAFEVKRHRRRLDDQHGPLCPGRGEVDAVHALTLQNANRFARVPSKEVAR